MGASLLLERLAAARPPATREAQTALRAALTPLAPGEIPAAAWPELERFFAWQAAQRAVVRASELPRLGSSGWASRCSVWQGDITTLAAGAIVNAANSAMTGCYEPLHACVDNAIHSAAGPGLREECARIMRERGRPEPTGTATATGGHYLPARHVLHTVGPIVGHDRSAGPGAEDARLLAQCYRTCWQVALTLPDVDSLAFCGISTGAFGYPPEQAAPLALRTVRELLITGSRLEHVVFVTYSERDRAAYANAVPAVLGG